MEDQVMTTPRKDNDRCQMATAIAERGSMQGDQLRAAMAWHIDRFSDAVYGIADRWFELTVKGWGLTEHGRNELAQSLQLDSPN
jgi:hypothetical protein